MLEHTNDLISLHNIADVGTCIYASSSYQTVLGYDPSLLIGQRGTLLVHPDDLEVVREQWSLLTEHSSTQAIIRYQHADSSWRWIETRRTHVRQQNSPYVIAVGRDVTAYKHLETRLNQIQKLNSIGRLAAGVAHDFHNVMTGISGYAALALLALPSNSELRNDLDEIQRSSARATSLTDQLLAFARREIGTPAVVDLNDVIRDIYGLLRRLIGEDIELVILPTAERGLVNVDAGQIEQVLMNLAVNACDAMPFGGQLVIETQNVLVDQSHEQTRCEVAPGTYLLLRVSDTGVGMESAMLQRIFEPFFTTKPVGRGTGLGLAICDEIIKQHGGHISVRSEPGAGTSFNIYLPHIELDATTAVQTLKGGIDHLPRGHETVLLVEDEPSVLALTARLLRRQGYSVLTASHGDEALYTAREYQKPIHLLLTDLVLPKLSGKVVAEQLTTIFPGLKVVFTSGYPDTTMVQYGQPTPTGTFLPKPFSHADLAQKVRAILDAEAIQ